MMDENLLPPIKVAVGETFDVSVPCNPTTGFACTLSDLPEGINLVNTEYVPSHPQLIGSGGTQVYMFVATKKGQGELQFQEVKFSKPLEISPQTSMEKRFVIAE